MTYEPTKDEMREIKEFIREYGELSHTWLQRKYGLSMEVAKQLKREIENGRRLL